MALAIACAPNGGHCPFAISTSSRNLARAAFGKGAPAGNLVGQGAHQSGLAVLGLCLSKADNPPFMVRRYFRPQRTKTYSLGSAFRGKTHPRPKSRK